ncbi:hypothetical protein SAZ10_00600 [Mesorhizobium sp. BAC0120]|uniref:hypothetical protein n=1 Tax=Mesorhizobium sp. BAC0120 TaxID=3090670 RepID=UPI00298D1503|nr:hypothetical protein [Mesorhizobium sp. BAC0120]MDW6020255.1 hypothetical protein [Mesorhizobium sp. BAC0120]
MSASEDDGDESGPGHPPLDVIKPGNSGRAIGARATGARSELGEAFLEDVLAAWEGQGPAAIQRMIDERPQDFVKMVTSLLPRDLNVNFNPIEQMTDEQLVERIRKLDAAIRPFLDALDNAEGNGRASGRSRAPAAR